jgi:hypothetical protein
LLDVTGFSVGEYRMTLRADGSVSWVPIVVLTPDGRPPAPPEDPDEPDPTSQFEAKIKAATAAVTDPKKANAAAALASLYETVGTLPLASVDQLRQATDLMFKGASELLPLHTSWTVWKAAVDQAVSSEGFSGVADAKAGWLTISKVLGASSGTQ